MTATCQAALAAALGFVTLPAYATTWPAVAPEAAAPLALGAAVGRMVAALEHVRRRKCGAP